MTLLTLVIIIGTLALIGGFAWAIAPTFTGVLKEKKAARDAEKTQKASFFRESQERQEKSRIAAEGKQRERLAKERAERHARLNRNPRDYILSFSYRNLIQTKNVYNEAKEAEDKYEDAKRDYEEFSQKEFSEGKVSTEKDSLIQHGASILWIALVVAQAGLTGWMLLALTGSYLLTILGTLAFVVVLEGPGVIISYLGSFRKKNLITETKQRLGIVVSCVVMIGVIATLSIMAGYRAYIVNEDVLIATHASQIEAAEKNDSYLLSVANEKEAQVNNRIRHEGIFFGVLEATIALFETVFALSIPACLMTRKYHRRKLSLDRAEQEQKEAKRRLKDYHVQKLTELAQIMEANQIDQTILEDFKEEGQLMLLPESIEAVPIKDYSAFFYGSKKEEARWVA